MHMFTRLLLGAGAIAWLYFTYTLYGQTPYSPQLLSTLLAGATTVALTVTALRGVSKFSAIAGKILIAISAVSIITTFIHEGIFAANIDIATRALVLVTGLSLERMSPHQRLYNWMFLMLATKLQFVITSAFIASAEAARASYFPLHYWWVLPLTMLCAVPFLAQKKRRWYRPIVLLTTGLALILAFDFITSQPDFSGATCIAVAAVLWPAAAERLLGYRTFIARRR